MAPPGMSPEGDSRGIRELRATRISRLRFVYGRPVARNTSTGANGIGAVVLLMPVVHVHLSRGKDSDGVFPGFHHAQPRVQSLRKDISGDRRH